MKTTTKINVNADIEVREGTSKKSGKDYKMTFLVIHTDYYGDVEILLDTKNDRAGILLELLTRY